MKLLIIIFFIIIFLILGSFVYSEDYHNIGDPYNTSQGELKFYEQPQNDLSNGFYINYLNRKKGTYTYFDPITKQYKEMEGTPLSTNINGW